MPLRMRCFLTQALFSSLVVTLASAVPPRRQEVLSPPPPEKGPAQQNVYEPASYLDIRPNAVGLAITTVDDEAPQVFFLPIGRKIQTRKCRLFRANVLAADRSQFQTPHQISLSNH